jgi:hypothetical protein
MKAKPRFVKVDDDMLMALDAYAALPENADREQPEWIENFHLTGPLVMEAARGTEREMRSLFPYFADGLQFFSDDGKNFAQWGDSARSHQQQVRGRVYVENGKITMNLSDWGTVTLRPLAEGDWKMFDAEEIPDGTTVDEMARFYFSGDKTTLDPPDEEEED